MNRSDRERSERGDRRCCERVPTGVPGLDPVLGGGLLSGRMYLLVGGPGTGKSVLANQFCYSRAEAGQRCLYVTLATESHSRLLSSLESLAYFDPSAVGTQVVYLSGARALRDGPGRFDDLFAIIQDEIWRRKPSVLVLDGFRLGGLLAGSEAEQILFFDRLAALLELNGCTALVNTTIRQGRASEEHAMADGLIELSHASVGLRSTRELVVRKLRGSLSLAGRHVFEIDERGAVVYPRTEIRLARAPGPAGELIPFGIAKLDQMLGGGIPAATSTAVVGPTGAGKTLLGLHFLAEGARREGPSLYLGFHESPARVTAQGDGVGLRLTELCAAGQLEICWSQPYENLADRVLAELLERVRQRGYRRVYIDGVEGLVRGAFYPERLPGVLEAATNELRSMGVTTVMSIEGEVPGQSVIPGDLVENIVALRYIERRSHLHRLLWLVKMRGCNFDTSAREFRISGEGIQLAATSDSAEAILSEAPRPGQER